VRDYKHLTFNLGAERLEAARALLARYCLSTEAAIHPEGTTLAGLCTVTLLADDHRLGLITDELESLGDPPLVRAERRYAKKELDRADWLVLRVATARQLADDLGQPYQRDLACPECGAGAEPIPPLQAHLRLMGKRELDRTAHAGHVIVSARLAAVMQREGLTGADYRSVSRSSNSPPNPGYRWLHVLSTFPRLDATARIGRDKQCPVCGRAGHFDLFAEPTELRFSTLPLEPADWNRTWEQFGEWRLPPARRDEQVGGEPYLIVSQRVRQLLSRERVSRLHFEPVIVQPMGSSAEGAA
jgi:hypothetical protein